VAAISKSKIVTASDVLWSDGSKFDGFLLLNIARPATYSEISLNQRRPRVVLPLWVRIPVEHGVLHTDTKVLYTSEYEPPNTRYISYWYDLNNAQLAGPSTLFTISTDPHTITVPTLTAPTAPVAGDTPDTEPATTLAAASFFVDNETPTGAINSTTGTDGNGTFTLAYAPTPAASLLLYRDGVTMRAGVEYTLSGSTITYTAGNNPLTGSWHRAFYRAQT